jgi:hypothetical protein
MENGVNGIVRRRWDTQCASKGAHLAGKPIKLQTPAVFEIVCHRSLPTGLDLVGDVTHAPVDKAGTQDDTLGFPYFKCLLLARGKSRAARRPP